MIPACDRARCDSAAESQDSRYQVWRVELQTTNHGYRIENYTSSSSSLWNRFLRFALVWLLSQSESRVKITNQQGNIINRIPNKKRSNAFISVLKNIFRKYQSCLNSCEIWLGRGPSDLNDCGARRRAAKVVTTRRPIHPTWATKFGRWNCRLRPMLTESTTRHHYLHVFTIRFLRFDLVRQLSQRASRVKTTN